MSVQTSLPNKEAPTKIQINISRDKEILVDCNSIPLSYLKLDPENVRFKHIPDELTDEQIEDYIWKETDTKKLLREIKYSQGLSEPPYVKKISDNEYLVIEGNRRTVCLRRLVEEIESRKEKNVPIEKISHPQCYVLPENLDESAIALLLARIHVSGKKTWNAMNKGAYVHELIKKYGYDWEEIAKAINMGKNTINQNVKAVDATYEYHKKYPDDDMWTQRFSHFLELYKRRGLKDWSENPHNLEKFMGWISKNQIPMAIHVRRLERIILEGKDAYQALQKGKSILEADEIAKNSEKNNMLSNSLSENVDNRFVEFSELFANLPRSKMIQIAKDKDQLKKLEILHQEFGQVLKDIKKLGVR